VGETVYAQRVETAYAQLVETGAMGGSCAMTIHATRK
jgi:hypothetical protein